MSTTTIYSPKNMANSRTSRRAAAKRSIVKKTTDIRTIIETFIAGFIHSDWDVNKTIPKGTILTMMSDPVNPYDNHAIKLMNGNVKVGYLPRESRKSYVVGYEKVWEAIRNGVPTRCVVMNHSKANPSYYAVKIRVEGEYSVSNIENSQYKLPTF